MLHSFRQPQRVEAFVRFQPRMAKSNRQRQQRSSTPRWPIDKLSDSAASASCHSLAIASLAILISHFRWMVWMALGAIGVIEGAVALGNDAPPPLVRGGYGRT